MVRWSFNIISYHEAKVKCFLLFLHIFFPISQFHLYSTSVVCYDVDNPTSKEKDYEKNTADLFLARVPALRMRK